ncbi:hypothetical protein M9Y10_022678 [Tritrichomonas musculus]|uniref:RING-type domain-containing protein n=1 Tax=Tritrichomonas musculus TaxID=1915356 RepID=A0ABR2KT31_9EUKA
MSAQKDTKKKPQEETDNSQLSAHETLMEIISSLQKISEMELKIPETIDDTKQKSDDSSDNPVQISCIFCKQPIERSNFIVSLQCCGAIAHIKCFAKISADEQQIIPHQCPSCKAKFSSEQIQICQKLSKMIPY